MKAYSEFLKLIKISFFIFKQYLKIPFHFQQVRGFFTEMYIRAELNQIRKGLDIIDIHLDQIYPGSESLPILQLSDRTKPSPADFLVSTKEIESLIKIAKYLGAKNFFEIGTWKGRTMANLLINFSPTCQFTSLDLLDQPAENMEIEEILKSKNYHRLIGNTINFDFSPYDSTVDFIFLDACHEYDAVKNDTKHALKMIAPNGVIVWHDYQRSHPGVVHFLNELSKELKLVNVFGTSLVVYRKPY